MESELFGYESGAFTGAKNRKVGLFEAANHGTIFLDEMGEIEIGLQAKLLRVLEDKKVRRLGGTRLHEVDVRIIVATNQDLLAAVRAKRFREDLFYRLHIVPIYLPPLRERQEDTLALAKYFLSEYARKFGRGFRGITLEAQALLVGYAWPGNVRELRHVIERICVMHDARMLEADHLPKELTNNSHQPFPQASWRDFPIPSAGVNLDDLVEQFTFHMIEKAVRLAEGTSLTLRNCWGFLGGPSDTSLTSMPWRLTAISKIFHRTMEGPAFLLIVFCNRSYGFLRKD